MSEARPANWIDEKRLMECIHCGFCLPACPTQIVTGEEMPSPRGRLYLMRAVLEGRLDPTDEAFHEHEWSCLVCRACETACPSGVEFGPLMEQTRALLKRTEPRDPLKDFLYRRVLTSRSRLDLLQRGLAFASRLGIVPLLRGAGRALRAVSPKLSSVLRLTPSGVRGPKKRPEAYCAVGSTRGTVGLLLGCVGEAFTSEINDATIRVLTRLGYRVSVFPSITCCGALHIHAGYRDEALGLGRDLLQHVDPDQIDFFVSNIAGCGAMLKDYEHLFAETESGERAQEFSRKVRDISEVLMDHLAELGDLAASRTERVGYQAACHLYHAQKVVEAPMAVLRALPGRRVEALAENEICCGSAGSYNIEHPEMSDKLLERKLAHIRATDAEVIVTSNAGCLLQLQKGVRETKAAPRVLHLIQYVDEALRQASGDQ